MDVFSVESQAPAQFDWLVHCRGDVQADLKPTDQPLGTTNGYQHLSELQTGQVAQVTFAQPGDQKLQMHFADPEAIVAGVGIGYRLTDRVPFVLRRRQATATTFVTVYDWSGDVQKVEQLPAKELVKLRITGEKRTATVTLDLRKESKGERLVWDERGD